MSITILIILATLAVSIPAFKNRELFYKLDFSPYQIEQRKEWYRFITHAFLHADWTHLIFNMFVLYMFGNQTQEIFEYYAGTKGVLYYILLYFAGIAFASLTTYRKHKHNPNYHSIGASGAVSAVLFSFIIFQPLQGLYLIIFPFFDLPAIVWGIAYLAYENYQAKKGNDHINHDAHFLGAIFGIVFTIICVPDSLTDFFAQITSALGF